MIAEGGGFAEWQQFHDFWAVQLSRRGEDAARSIEDRFGAHRTEQARALLELAVRLEAPGGDPPAAPDDPDAPAWCGWCGRTRPPHGLQDDSMGGPPSWTCTEPDLDDCLRVHEQRVTGWREFWEPSAGMGYHYVEHRAPAWLTALAGDARLTLGAADAARMALAAWQTLHGRADARAAGIAASAPQGTLAGPAPETADAPPDAPAPSPSPRLPAIDFDSARWSHTMRNARNRAHTLGSVLALPGVQSAPDAIAAKRTGRHP